MAIDFLILCLLLISLTINLLALGGFWVTPGLRTTANRFVINLLIVNIIGCLILAPTLFLRSSSSTLSTLPSTTIKIFNDIKIEDFGKNHYAYIHENNKIYENNDKHNDTIISEANIIKCINDKCEKIYIDKEKFNDETIVFTEMDLNLSKTDDDNVLNIPTIIENIDGNKNNIVNKNNRIKEFGVNNNLAAINTITDNYIEGLSNSISDEDVSSGGSSRSISSSNDGIPFNTLKENNIILKKSKSYLPDDTLPSTAAINNIENNDNDNVDYNNKLPYIQRDIRCWSLDLVAALGALSVLLIVGDTWCAVTDPLRYHSRISGLKAWILIAILWILGITFGILSALRETIITTQTTKIYQKNANNNTVEMERFIEDSLYNLIFSCIYFIIIILLPFGFVCGMYWRIFSEARENGLRMRQNGSSPLLQSAFNLSGHGHHHSHNNNNNNNNHHHQQQQQNQHQTHLSINHQNNNNNNISNLTLTKDHIQGSTGGGLQMRIDHNIKDGTNKPLLLPPQTTISQSSEQSTNDKLLHKDRNENNILLTLSEATEDIKRNYSSRHLSILGSQDFYDGHNHRNGIRQVHSTPNLQKYQRNSDGSLIDIDEHVLVTGQNGHHRHALQLPTIIHTSPKALGYMTSIRHRLSNASSLFKYREESRAARISILVVIMFLVSYLPYGILVILQGRVFQLSNYATQLAIFFVLLGNISSPFIFAYRNKRVRRGVKRIFNLDPRAKDRQLQRRGIMAHNNSHNGLIKCLNGTNNNNNNNNNSKTSTTISVRHNGTKVTTYSLNTTCKFLTPHAVTAAGTFLVDLERCHYLKNGYTDGPAKNCTDLLLKSNKTLKTINSNVVVPDVDLIDDLEDDDDGLSDNSIDNHNDLTNGNSIEKRSILKIVCDSSRKLGCAGGGGSNSCASSDCENEPTDV